MRADWLRVAATFGAAECGSSPCANGGTCTDFINNFVCTCAVGYSGINCQTNINGSSVADFVIFARLLTECCSACAECASSPCRNGATCIDQVNAFYCNCVLGYSGVQCHTDIDECASAPCANGGTCTD